MIPALLALVVAALGAPVAACEAVGAEAVYTAPTDRYPHGALGDALEWGGLRYQGETTVEITLDDAHVFEDAAPSLVDFDGDCAPEIVTVRAHAREGAQLAIYAVERDALRLIAATPYIGTRFRWLAPAGAADFDGDGRIEVALVRTPHLAGVLEFWGFDAGGLALRAARAGFSNHRFGDPDILGGARDCGDGPEIALADIGWRRTVIARLEQGEVVMREYAERADRATLAAATACE